MYWGTRENKHEIVNGKANRRTGETDEWIYNKTEAGMVKIQKEEKKNEEICRGLHAWRGDSGASGGRK